MVAYFTLDFIKILCDSSLEFTKGLEIFENYGTLETKEDFDGTIKEYKISILDFDEQVHVVTLKIDLNGNLVYDSCDCGVGGCRHFVCASLNFVKDKQSGVQNVQMQSAKKMLCDIFKGQLSDTIVLDDEKVKIFPYINFGDNTVFFKIGRRRSYVIKNLSQLLTNLETNEYFSYGSNLEFRHNRKSFSDIANKYIDLISGDLELTEDYANVDPKKIVLKKVNVDRFFDLFVETKIFISEGKDNLENFTIGECVTDTLPIKFNISYENNVAKITRPKNTFRQIVGIDYFYVLMGNKIYRTSKIVGEILDILSRTFSIMNTTEISYSLNELDEFLSYIYPVLVKYGLISSDSLIDNFNLTKPKTTMYLDVEKGDIIARVKHQFSVDNGYRDRLRESEIKDILREYAFNKFGDTETEEFVENEIEYTVETSKFKLRNTDSIYSFLLSGVNTLKSTTEVFMSTTLNNYVSTLKFTYPKFDIRLSNKELYNVGLLDIKIDMDNVDIKELTDVLKSYKENKKYHKLTDDTLINLNSRKMKEALEFLISLEDDVDLEKGFENNILTVPLYRGFYLEGITASFDDDFLKIINTIKNFKDYAKTIQCTSLKVEPRSYQLEGYAWLRLLYDYGLGGILADEMGLGKTLQAIMLMSSIPNVRALCVVPASILYNWEREIEKFSDNLSVVLINGTKQEREQLLKQDVNIYVTTYETLRRDIDLYNDLEFDILIADEAQNIKNFEIQTSRAIRKINRKNTFALTGTPIENSLKELWGIFDFIMPKYLYTYNDFQKRVMKPIYDGDEDKVEFLRRQISPFILRRFKNDVLEDLPQKIEQTIYCQMHEEQEKLYLANILEARGEINNNDDFSKNGVNIISKITRLRQIVDSPNLVTTTKKEIPSGKVDTFLELVNNIIENEHRALVFSQFTSMLSILKEKLDDMGIEYFYLDGNTPPRDRFKYTEQFNNGERSLFLISLKAGGTGLNLTGADVVIHFDPWWNPSVMEQATDRAHRIGQQKIVQVFNLITENTIEEKILELCMKKKGLVEKVMTNDPSELKGITAKELLSILEE